MAQKVTRECECGKVIYGTSDSQVWHNIRIHRQSKEHERLMELKMKWLDRK